MSFLGMDARIFGEILPKLTFLHTRESSSKRYKLAYHFRLYYGVSHRGVSRDENGEFGVVIPYY